MYIITHVRWCRFYFRKALTDSSEITLEIVPESKNIVTNGDDENGSGGDIEAPFDLNSAEFWFVSSLLPHPHLTFLPFPSQPSDPSVGEIG
jgi:hypothetical protein